MKKSCFVIPVHEPKFEFAIPLVLSYNSYYNDGDIFFVFSNEHEKNLFENQLNNKDVKYNSIIFTGNQQHWIVTQKKWFGIDYIFNHYDYDYVGAVDAEVMFLRYLDYNKIFYEKTIDNFIFYTYVNDIFFPFTYIELLKIFKKTDQDKIKKIIFDDKTEKINSTNSDIILDYAEQIFKVDLLNTKNFWFNDIPVYERNTFGHFINYLKIDITNGTINDMQDDVINTHPILPQELMGGHPFNFDHIIYVYYLICMNKCKFKEIPYNDNTMLLKQVPGSFAEKQLYCDPQKFMEAYSFTDSMWMYKKVDDEYMKNTFMEFHTDRNFKSELIRIKNDAWMLEPETIRDTVLDTYFNWLKYYNILDNT